MKKKELLKENMQLTLLDEYDPLSEVEQPPPDRLEEPGQRLDDAVVLKGPLEAKHADPKGNVQEDSGERRSHRPLGRYTAPAVGVPWEW